MNPKYNRLAGQIAKGLEPYTNIYYEPLRLKNLRMQNLEMRNQVPIADKEFHTPLYEKLVADLQPLRQQFL